MRLALVLALLWSAPSPLLSGAQDSNQQPAGDPNADSFQIVSVSPSVGTPLQGNHAEFRARVRYTLDSMDQAILLVFAERFRNTPEGCNAPAGHQSEGSSATLVKKGTGEMEVTLTWYGSAGPRSIVPEGASFVGLGMSLLAEKDGGPVPPGRILGISSFCYSVSPAPQDTNQSLPAIPESHVVDLDLATAIVNALPEFQEAVTRAPDNPVSRYNLGVVHLLRAELEQARQQFMKAIELRPDYVRARLSLAHLQVNRREYDAGLKTAEAVLAVDQGNVEAGLLELEALMSQKRFGDSRVLLDAMLKANPNSPDVLFQLGAVNLAENRFKEAEDAFRRSYQLNLDPTNLQGLMGIIDTKMAQNRTEEAFKILQAESDKAPNRVDLLIAIGDTAVRAGKFDFAIEAYIKAIVQAKTESEKGDIYLKLSETYRRKGDLDNAIVSLEDARKMLPRDYWVLSALGVALEQAGRKAEARRVYETTLELYPNDAAALKGLALLMAETGGDLDDALAKARRAQQLLPSLVEISDTLGWIYLKKNRTDDAIQIFRDVVTKEPDHSTYHFHLGMAYAQKGDTTNALDQLREALNNHPSNEEKDKIQPMIARMGSSVAAAPGTNLPPAGKSNADPSQLPTRSVPPPAASSTRGPAPPTLSATAEDFYRDAVRQRSRIDYAGAIQSLDRALELRPGWLLAITARADNQYRAKRYDEAIAGYDRAIQLDPKRAASYDSRGLVYSNSGRHGPV